MTNLEIGLVVSLAITFICVAVSTAIWIRYARKLHKRIELLKKSLVNVKASNKRLKEQADVYAVRSAATLNRTLFLWKEEVDDLKAQLAFKENLLQQKWKAAKSNVSK